MGAMGAKPLGPRPAKRRPSLLRTLMVQIGLVLVAGGILINSAFFVFAYNVGKRDFDSYMALSTQQMADTFTHQLWLFDLATTRRFCHMAVDSVNIAGIRLYDHNQKIIAESGTFPDKGTITIFRTLTYQDQTLVGYMEIRFVNTLFEQHLLITVLAACCMVLFTAVSSFTLIFLVLNRHLTRPLKQLHQEMHQMTSGSFSGSEMTGQKAEIQGLVNGFNQMARALAAREQSKQQAEQRLSEEKAVMEAIIQTLPGIFVVHVQGQGLVRWNDNFEVMSGLPSDQIRGKAITHWIDPAEREGIVEKLAAAFNTEASGGEFEAELCFKAGKVPYLISVRQCRIQGQKVTIGMGIDLTERKSLEVSLRRAQKMESIGTLAGGIAHDFNNIIFPMMGYAELLREDLPDKSFQKEAVEAIYRASVRAGALVRQILSLSRQQEEAFIPLKVQPILKEAVGLLEACIPRTIRIQKTIDSDCGLVVADPTQVHQIIMNLGTNAYHAMEKTGGILSFSLQTVEIGPDQGASLTLCPGAHVLLKVKDTGVGIDPAHIDRIFDPYFTTKLPGRGTGLGLSIVQGIVRRCRGEICLQSRPGQGTEVSVYLPVAETPEALPVEESGQDVLAGKESVLLLDDEAAILSVVSAILSRLGYRVTTMQDPLKAARLTSEELAAFDLVITDMTMPGMTGIQLNGRLKALRPELPVILCSGFSHEINGENIAEVNIQAYLEKPVQKQMLAKVIRRVLDEA